MAYISSEEENYVRMGLLLTEISPRAVKTFFDSKFSPASLGASLKKEYNKLLDFKKKHIINQSQWNLLFPSLPDVADSKTFDITLMTTLLRHITSITPPLHGFDHLPTAMETTPGADLARIKNYRNYQSHQKEGIVRSADFNTAWDDISGAIERLGGQAIKEECDELRIRPLGQSTVPLNIRDVADSKTFDITLMTTLLRHITSITPPLHGFDHLPTAMETTPGADLARIKNYRNYQSHQKEGIVRSADFNTAWDDISRAIERLGGQAIKEECDELRIRPLGQSTVPLNIRVHNAEMLEDWKHNDKMFIQTRAAKHVLKCLQENNCVTITASSGVGKTATLRHVALQMSKDVYDVLLVSDPFDIVKFYNPVQKTLFLIDDLCGVYSINLSEIHNWETVMKRIKGILLNKLHTKIVAACRLQVYQDKRFESLSIFKSYVCNLLSEGMCLSKAEKQSIAELYLKKKASKITEVYDLYKFFPTSM